MALKTTSCPTVDSAQKAVVDPNTGVAHAAALCPGQYIPYEGGDGLQFLINGKVYNRYEKCQRCGNIIPG